jgi:hypothetical protein
MMPLAISNLAKGVGHRQRAHHQFFKANLLGFRFVGHYCSYRPIARLISFEARFVAGRYRTSIYGKTTTMRDTKLYEIYNAPLVPESSQCHAS